MVHVFTHDTSIIQQYIAEIRDKGIQKDRMRFRRNIERIGELAAYEISKYLSYESKEVETPLGTAQCQVLKDEVVLGAILRAGLPLHQGMLNVFDKADSAIVSAYRKHTSETSFEIQVEYMSAPSLVGKILILCDPMIATGMSMVAAYKALVSHYGTPARLHVFSVIASEQGLEYIRHHLPQDSRYWIVALDPELNAKSYIVPGIGDAGDLSYGEKI